MHIKNKLGIHVYPNDVLDINGIDFEVNSISHTGNFDYTNKFRIIDDKIFGIELFIETK